MTPSAGGGAARALDPGTEATALITDFLRDARWFGGKGRTFAVTVLTRVAELPGEAGAQPRVAIDLATLEYDDGTAELYQLPLSFYSEPQPRLEHALVGLWQDTDFGPAYVYDALHDRDAMARWLHAFADEWSQEGVVFRRLPGHELDLGTHSTLFSGEQSNSSVMFGDDALMKVFRRVTPGVNPDIEIHEVLTRAGSEHVAALYGWLEAPGEPLHLAMLQQFLRTASDGFELAKASVRNLFAEEDLYAEEVGGDFAAEAARLGEALADTHRTLAAELPTVRLDRDRVSELASGMRGRLDDALTVVPRLEPHADHLRATYDAFGELDQVEAQRIHGDLHLGQTLRTVKGWKLVDFEGEPAKPLADRLLPDSRWRDVAGMLRSFDYAPAVVQRTTWETDQQASAQRDYRAAEWVARNRRAFVDAYAAAAAGDAVHDAPDSGLSSDETVLLAAYEADKAVYEAVYETRNRPTWVDIPLAAIERLAR